MDKADIALLKRSAFFNLAFSSHLIELKGIVCNVDGCNKTVIATTNIVILSWL